MFKKFKDKLAEEMKQSPSRLQAGMQQLAQAVISPAASNNLIQDLTTSVDDLNLTTEEAETVPNNSATSQFQSIDLQSSNSMERSRRSSFSSVTSENFFPTYESPGNLYHLQSDMEQSASEFEDGSSPLSDLMVKEQVFAKYNKLRTKYTKYRAVYRELYKENMKMKSVLVETQDKALRRIANLKEQCQLEQEAKAHLEEALRNDIEEKDHLINTLNTKIELLQSNETSGESLSTSEAEMHSEKSNFDLLTESITMPTNANDSLISENASLKERIKKFETLLAKCNESLKRNKEKIAQLTENRDILERDLNILRNTNEERRDMLESEIYKAKHEILSLNEQIEVLKKREEDSALSLAENKLFIHRELEVKEEQNKRLEQELKKITEYKDILAEAVVNYDREFRQFGVVINDRNVEPDKKLTQLKDLFTSKSDALKLVQQDVKQKFRGAEQEMRSKHDKEMNPIIENSTPVRQGVNETEEISRSSDEIEIQNAQLLGLTTELKSCKSTINDLKEMLREVTMDGEQVKKEKECLIANILHYKKTLCKLKQDCNSIKVEAKKNYSEQESMIHSVSKEFSKIYQSAHTAAKKEETKALQEEYDTASSVELKTIINDNNALRKKCEQLMEQNEEMLTKVNDFDGVNSKNIKLISEIDELNFKMRDIAELQEAQDKMQQEMESLRSKMPFSNNTANNNDHFSNEVALLKEKLNNYDALTQDNTALKQQLVDLKNELAAALNNMEVLKSTHVKNLDLGVENFTKNCEVYESTITNLTSKFTEQTRQLEKLHEELRKQKDNFRDLSDKLEVRNSEFKEANETSVKQVLELKNLNEKHKTQCDEIEALRERDTEILRQLDETVKVRQDMVTKFNELESCKNNIIDAKTKEFEELKLRYERLLIDLESSEETKTESVIMKTDEIAALTRDKVELVKEIDQLNSQNEEISILRSANATQQQELETLKINYMELTEQNKELKEEQNNLLKTISGLELSENKLKQQNDELQVNISKLENDLKCLQEKLEAEMHNINESKLLQIELQDAKSKIQNTQLQNAELCNTVAALQLKENSQAALKGELDTSNKLLTSQVKDLQSQLHEFENLRRANVELEKVIENYNSQIQILNIVKTENVELQKEIAQLNGKMKRLSDFEVENRNLNIQIENLKSSISEQEICKSENQQLHRELEISHKAKDETSKEVQDLLEENEKLNSQVENLQSSLNQKDAELDSTESKNAELLCKLETINSDQLKSLEDKSKTISELENRAKDFENKFIEQQKEVEAFKIINEDLADQLIKINANHSKILKNETEKNIKLVKAASEFENTAATYQLEVEALKMMNHELNDKLKKINSDHSKTLEATTLKISELEKTVNDFEIKFVKKQQEVQALETLNKKLHNQLEKINADHSKDLENNLKTITELEKAVKDGENKIIGRREEVEALETANKDLREQLLSISQNKNADEVLTMNCNRLQDENKKLQTRVDEAVLLYETKESQIQMLTNELKQQTEMMSEKFKTNEEEQLMRIKQLVKEFQAQIHDKDDQIQAALEKRFERQQNYESELIQQYKEQLKDFQVELTAKSEQIENLIMDNKETIQAYKDQIEELTQTIDEVKKEHTNELQNIERNWKSVLQQRTDQLESKHMDEVNELTKEWSNERKAAENCDTSAGELESTSHVAMATIQSNTGSLHSLQQTLISQKRELAELRKLLRIRNDSLEGSTEIEYLRNILFEYMMGRETLVLTRVISAVVKFDQEQTSKVLKKEEDKLTLLGSLGLL
ncbi:golgin subfamily A member 4-like isoform X1 [Neodiprion virginianus]|uniref:golgin subfamily A member 4-like isoform X1 n=2 Tax=Neodiprion virginianus TaxID=2961670 RepID=UPI001EE6CA00|nr:golgin subfamily A member 4-like isoform X1 [Neodiprion virginianus]